MKLQDSVSTVSGSAKLPASVTTYLQHNKDEFDDDDVVKGGVLQDFKFAWLANGSKFVVINIKSGHKIAAWTFGAVLRDFKTRVMCVCEIPPLIENTKQLLIGLECDMIGGLVCLFHCQGSRVLRAIRLDCRVSCLQYVDNFPSGHLQCFDGTVIIGTHGGSVLAFDLNRRSCVEAIMHGKSGREALIRDELNIGNLFTLSLEDIALIEEQRTIACEKDDHIAIQINEGCFRNLQFILHAPDNSAKIRATREKVFVTCLLYIPQLGSVVIGFNFGAFQLWNAMTLELEFTSSVSNDQLPISHFGFLEPCDDPRAFSYLWVIYSSLDRHEEGFPLAAMYAFSYQGKTSLGDGTHLYQNFISCNLRFNVELGSVDSSNINVKQMIGGRSLACHTLSKSVGRNKDSDESILNLCQIVWECWTVSAITPVQSVMIIFDIDQWYKEQMPELTILESNSFLSVVNLGDTLSHTASCYLCDVRINKDSLSPFYSVPRLEEHYYPNSLGYECVCLTNMDVTRLNTVGVQRQLLTSLSEIGPSVLLHPTKVFTQCLACGLVPLYMEPPPNFNTPLPVQRQTILSIALEARLICFLSDCARDWATGSHSSVGCSLASFVQWAWSRTLTLKSNADQLTMPLFDHSRDGPDANSVSCLESCTRQLGHVAKLFDIMLDKCANLMLPEAIKELKPKQKAVQVVSLYFQVVQWFLNVGLLPEFSMNSQHDLLDRNTNRLPYPADSLVRYYQNRRFKLHCLNGENPAVENLQNKSCPLLFIDQFIKMECAEDKLKQFWLDDGSDIKGLYPPPSLLSLLRTYLIPSIQDENKHSLVLYVLVDYAMTFDEARHESVIRRLMQFPTMFGLSNNAIKITQAFWHLDHRDFELALDQLESVVAGGWLKQWQHNVALSSLLVQNKTQAALQYLYVRKPLLPALSRQDAAQTDNILYENDWETCCNLYLSRGLLLEAFNATKDSFKTLYSNDLKEQRMIMFLEGCKKTNLLSKALMLPLSEDDEIVLTNFLKALGDSDAHDLLIMYYLQRSRFIEAQHVNDNLKRLTTKGQLPYDVSSDFSSKKDHIPKTKTRDELVDMYCKTLPKVTRNLAHLASQHILPSRISMPTPMTVNLQAVVPKPATYRSSIIQATINKANETWLERPTVARNLKRALQVEDTPFICTPKMERHSSRLNDFEKMITTPEDMNISPSPAKKPRLVEDDAENCALTPEDPKVRREVESLLHTPLVERKSHWRRDSRADSTREATPQSILKVRTKLLDCGSSLDERLYAETDEEFDTASVNTQSDNLSRSIRFNIPSSRSITPTDLNESFEELSGIHNFGQNSLRHQASLSVSTRRSIHYSQQRDDVEIPSVPNVSTPIKRTPLRGRKLLSSSNSPVFEDKSEAQDDGEIDDKSDGAVNEEMSNSSRLSVIKEIHVEIKKASDVEKGGKSVEMEEDTDSLNEEPLTPTRVKDVLKKGPQPRRSLRNTPEREKSEELNSSRVLRSRSRTPEREISSPVIKMSPTKSTPGLRSKKSLARIVLEANAMSVSKEITKSETVTERITHIQETRVEEEITESDDVTNTTKYHSLMDSKLMETLCSKNESLLSSDRSDADLNDSNESDTKEEIIVPVDSEITITEIPDNIDEEIPAGDSDTNINVTISEPSENAEVKSQDNEDIVLEIDENQEGAISDVNTTDECNYEKDAIADFNTVNEFTDQEDPISDINTAYEHKCQKDIIIDIKTANERDYQEDAIADVNTANKQTHLQDALHDVNTAIERDYQEDAIADVNTANKQTHCQDALHDVNTAIERDYKEDSIADVNTANKQTHCQDALHGVNTAIERDYKEDAIADVNTANKQTHRQDALHGVNTAIERDYKEDAIGDVNTANKQTHRQDVLHDVNTAIERDYQEDAIADVNTANEQTHREDTLCDTNTAIERDYQEDALAGVDSELNVPTTPDDCEENLENQLETAVTPEKLTDDLEIIVTPEKQQTLNRLNSARTVTSEDLTEFVNVVPESEEDIENVDVNIDDNDIDIISSAYDQIQHQDEFIDDQNVVTVMDDESNSDNLVIDTDVYERNPDSPRDNKTPREQADESLLQSDNDSEDQTSDDEEIREDDKEESGDDSEQIEEEEDSNGAGNSGQSSRPDPRESEVDSASNSSQEAESAVSEVIHILSSDEEESNLCERDDGTDTTAQDEISDDAENADTHETSLDASPPSAVTGEELMADPITLKLSDDEMESPKDDSQHITTQVPNSSSVVLSGKSENPIECAVSTLDKSYKHTTLQPIIEERESIVSDSNILSTDIANVTSECAAEDKVPVKDSLIKETLSERKEENVQSDGQNDKSVEKIVSETSKEDNVTKDSSNVSHRIVDDKSAQNITIDEVTKSSVHSVKNAEEDSVTNDSQTRVEEKDVSKKDNRVSEPVDEVKSSDSTTVVESKPSDSLEKSQREKIVNSNLVESDAPTLKTPEKVDLDSSIARSTRSASKNRRRSSTEESISPTSEKMLTDDDRSSVVSVFSNKSLVATDSPISSKGEPPASSRKSRKFSLAKTNLSVIPEVSQGEWDKSDVSRLSQNTTLMDQYISSKRLTRNQKSLLEKSFTSSTKNVTHKIGKKQARKSSGEDVTYYDTEKSGKKMKNLNTSRKNLTDKTINRLELLNKQEFKGQPDPEEITRFETASVSSISSSIVSDFTDLIPNAGRTKRASSEIILTTPGTKKTRRSSVDAGRTKRASSEIILTTPGTKKTRRSSVDAGRTKRASSEIILTTPGTKKTRRSSVDAGRTKRASSEIILTTPGTKKTRRSSVDAGTLDESVSESPGRPRRRSFNKAVEALITPKRHRRTSTDSKNDSDEESDTSMSDRRTPKNFKGRKSEMNKSKLIVIEEDDDSEDSVDEDSVDEVSVDEDSVDEDSVDEDESMAASVKSTKRVKKTEKVKKNAKSCSTPDNKGAKKSRTRMSILTPLSKEDQREIEKPRPRRRTTMHKVIQPIEFVPKKK